MTLIQRTAHRKLRLKLVNIKASGMIDTLPCRVPGSLCSIKLSNFSRSVKDRNHTGASDSRSPV